MKKYVLICIAVLWIGSAHSQSWCTPGAEWTYWYQCQCPPKIIKIMYTGTVTVNGYTCQQLNRQSIYTDFYMTQTYTSTSVPTYTTRESNNVIFMYKSSTNSFDTLYDFNAIPGNKWLLPDEQPASGCNRHMVTVLDTGQRIINSVNLRWLKVTIFDNTGFASDTIFERIGFKKFFYLQHFICPIPPAADPPFVAGLRCYTDAQINYKLINTTCDYIYLYPSSIDESSSFSSVNIYPNPTTTSIFVTYDLQEAKAVKLVMTNSLGQVVHIVENALPSQEIDLSTLGKGLYFLSFQSGDQQKVFKILRE